MTSWIVAAGLMVGALAAQGPADPVFAEWRERVDPAVERALDALARAQNPDGSFPGPFGDSTGIPALAGMAFLSRGHLPTEGPYAGAINRSIDFVLNHQKDNGLFEKGGGGSGPMYAHNIATLFLSEVSGMVDPVRQARIGSALPEALGVIYQAQQVPKNENDQGGWRYHPGSRDSDTSCSGWALMALRSAKLNGAAVPDKAIEDAVAYLERHQDPETGTFGYSGRNDHAETLTGMGLLCLELCGRHGTERTTKAGDYVMKTYRGLPDAKHGTYGLYYTAQGLFQLGGSYWSEFAPWMYETFLGRQDADGLWESNSAGKIYGTSMMVLAFTVPYRQLPIYQRDETVDEE
jgi:hypothetical protein